jgi:AcrR family transcriptional regulator
MSEPVTRVQLLETTRPQQQRAIKTYEGILHAAAELLDEVGVERISTNLIAERAGVTVPALYRYFPNKYAVLNSLGARLMDQQNQVFERWQASLQGADDPSVILLDGLEDLLRLTLDATRQQIAGLAIMRALRVVAPLRDVRLESHRLVAGLLADNWVELFPDSVADEFYLHARLTIEMGYAVVEMVLEENEFPTEFAIKQGAHVLRLYWQDLLQQVGVG